MIHSFKTLSYMMGHYHGSEVPGGRWEGRLCMWWCPAYLNLCKVKMVDRVANAQKGSEVSALSYTG